MHLSLRSALVWTLPAMVVAGVVGGYFTWRVAGLPALQAEMTAGAINLVVMLGNAAGMVAYARRNTAGKAALAFMAASMVRTLACVGLILAAWKLAKLPLTPLAVWAVSFYLLALAGETAWMARALTAPGAASTAQGVDRALGR
jgi:hypothetical protein